MALLGGLGGGITRDVLLGDVPSALTNPAYITLALGFGVIGYSLAYTGGQLFREGLFQFMTSFSLPWYAIVGAQKGVGQGIPVLGCILLAVVGPTAGRWYIDVSSGVTPEAVHPRRVVRDDRGADGGRVDPPLLGERQLVGARDRVRRRIHGARDGSLVRVGGAAREGADGRLQALRRPADARPQARKGKSQRELRDLGLLVEDGHPRPIATEPRQKGET